MRSPLFVGMLLWLALVPAAVPSPPPRVILGVLEDVPDPNSREPISRGVRVLFEKSGAVWRSFPNPYSDDGSRKTPSLKYPAQVTWTIAFDGRNLGSVTSRASDKFDNVSQATVQ